MFNFLVTQSLKNRLLVLAIAAVLILYGGFTVTKLPVDVFPDLNRPTVTIMTEAEGLAPPEVEQLVTYPIETQMNGLPGVTRVRSTSGVGLSIVYVEFDWNTEIYRNRQQIAERWRSSSSSCGERHATDGPDQFDHGPDHAHCRHGTGQSLADGASRVGGLHDQARLLTIPGVAQVIPIGGEVRQYRVSPNPAAMRALGISFEQVEAALAQFGANTGGGFTDQYSREFLIRNIGRTVALEDLRGLAVATVNGQLWLWGRLPKSASRPA